MRSYWATVAPCYEYKVALEAHVSADPKAAIPFLSNRIFKFYDDLVDHYCEGWNKLVDQPWRIMSIGLRQWAHGF